MAGPSAPSGYNPLVAGLFGALQTTSAARASTTDVWDNLRQAAGSWALGVQGAPQPYDPVQVDTLGRQVLSEQGVGLAEVNYGRQVAGQWRSATEALQALEPTQQITAREIFVPPWATTDNPNVPSQYRIRSQWQFDNAAGVQIEQWRSDLAQGPLTSTGDVIGQAADAQIQSAGAQGRVITDPGTLLGFGIEQV